MFNFIKKMSKRVKQKKLVSQIYEFLSEDEHERSNLLISNNWLLEFVDQTNASEAKEITAKDIEEFAGFVLSVSTPYIVEGARKTLRKFFRWCLKKRYIYRLPSDVVEQPSNEDKKTFARSLFHSSGPMPDIDLIHRIRHLRNVEGKPFRDIVKILTKELGRKQYLSGVYRLYRHPKVV